MQCAKKVNRCILGHPKEYGSVFAKIWNRKFSFSTVYNKMSPHPSTDRQIERPNQFRGSLVHRSPGDILPETPPPNKLLLISEKI